MPYSVLFVALNSSLDNYVFNNLNDSTFLVDYESELKSAIRKIKFKKNDIILIYSKSLDSDFIQLIGKINEAKRLKNTPIICHFENCDQSERIKSFEFGVHDCLVGEQNPLEIKLKFINLIQLSQSFILSNPILEDNQLEPNSINKFMEKLTACIEENLPNKDLDLITLSKKLSVSTSTIQKKIKKETGKSVSVFISEYRLNRAQILIESGNYQISEIVELVGFGGASYFSKCYKDYFGFTPSKKNM